MLLFLILKEAETIDQYILYVHKFISWLQNIDVFDVINLDDMYSCMKKESNNSARVTQLDARQFQCQRVAEQTLYQCGSHTYASICSARCSAEPTGGRKLGKFVFVRSEQEQANHGAG